VARLSPLRALPGALLLGYPRALLPRRGCTRRAARIRAEPRDIKAAAGETDTCAASIRLTFR
jgi:hypothetical protein